MGRVLAFFLALACLAMGGQASAEQAKPVVVFAAASLQTALSKIGAEWGLETGKSVTFSFAASSTLVRQIDAGAPADVIATADLDWMDWAEAKKLINPVSRRQLLKNRLVLIAQRGDAIALKIAPGFPLAAAIGEGKLATGEIKSVPVGRYAQAALKALGVWDEVSSRVAGADSVRIALALVARGEARLGIVYQTDANAEPKVRTVDTFPASAHPPIVYPFALTATSGSPDAKAFLDFLAREKAARIFRAEGFEPLN